jgi:cell growth-regulating nucleolar protein
VVPHKAYVEDDADDEYYHNNDPAMPEAPSPPSAVPNFTMESDPAHVNVFDFLVESTPNASRLELPAPEPMQMIQDAPEENDNRSLVRVRFDESNTDLVEYGSGPVHTSAYETPAPRDRKKERKDREHRDEKKDKKRKRLHVDTQDLSTRDADAMMTDAPPVLHSGLTGGLNRLLSRPSVFPPSPDYSGDAGDASPPSPLKKAHSKHTKRGRVDAIGNGIMSLITTRASREHSDERNKPKRKHRKHKESDRPSRKMIEYKPESLEQPVENGSQMIVYQPKAELLLSFISKGPESERGLSMNKALKRYHRERQASGEGLGKQFEEKELWKSLRMKRNEVGEIVLFL